jgi:hypothetical protein
MQQKVVGCVGVALPIGVVVPAHEPPAGPLVPKVAVNDPGKVMVAQLAV